MCNRCKDQTSDAFVRGMATIMWASSWADHAEEHDCCNLSGTEITSVMPDIPELAWRMAERLAGKIEQANGLSLASLYAQAMKHTGRELDHADYWSDEGRDSALRFGECLAYMAMGHGVSWYDDNPEFMIELTLREPYAMRVPRFEAYELQVYADETCPHTKGGECSECGEEH